MVIPFAALSAGVFRQLPTYDGTKSYQNLLVEVYETSYSDGWITDSRNFGGEILISSLTRSGRYSHIYGSATYLGSEGYYFTKTAYNSAYTASLAFSGTSSIIMYTGDKGYGFKLRCLVR